MTGNSSERSGARRLKVAEIAQLAGTSPATVSKVINGYGSVSDATRQRIEQVLSSVNYSKKPVKHVTSRNIALLIDRMDHPWVTPMLSGAMRYADRNGLNLIIVSRTDDDGALSPYYLQSLRRAKPLAVVVNTADLLDKERELFASIHAGYAIIDLRGNVASEGLEVRLDNWAGGLEVGRHLIGLGHRRIAIITGPDDMMCFRARLDGCKAAMSEASIPLDPSLICPGDEWSELARRQTLRLLAMENPPTAIFATCDTQVVGVYDAAHQMGVDIPREVSVVGFDDNEYLWHAATPLTTVRQPYADMTERAFRLVLESEDDDPDRKVLIPPKLIVRDSTGPVRVR